MLSIIIDYSDGTIAIKRTRNLFCKLKTGTHIVIKVEVFEVTVVVSNDRK